MNQWFVGDPNSVRWANKDGAHQQWLIHDMNIQTWESRPTRKFATHQLESGLIIPDRIEELKK